MTFGFLPPHFYWCMKDLTLPWRAQRHRSTNRWLPSNSSGWAMTRHSRHRQSWLFSVWSSGWSWHPPRRAHRTSSRSSCQRCRSLPPVPAKAMPISWTEWKTGVSSLNVRWQWQPVSRAWPRSVSAATDGGSSSRPIDGARTAERTWTRTGRRRRGRRRWSGGGRRSLAAGAGLGGQPVTLEQSMSNTWTDFSLQPLLWTLEEGRRTS